MAVQWKVTSVKRNPSNGAVLRVFWILIEREIVGDVSHEGRSIFHTDFTPDPTADNFIAYENLTEEIVLGWLKTFVGADEIALLEQELTYQVTSSKNGIEIFGKPW
tara:strand:+ start:141 stop:458 length:318 start_codon:yes stop_codon:yes gene_type:complete